MGRRLFTEYQNLCGPQALQFQPNMISDVLLVKLLYSRFIFEGGEVDKLANE
jgi:hypothetical protein